jgi:hypothetical protein
MSIRRLFPAFPASLVFLFLPLLMTAQSIGAQSAPSPAESAPALDDVLAALPAGDRAALLKDGELLKFHPEGVRPELLPETALTAAVARRIVEGELTIGIEGLFFTPAEELPASWALMDRDARELVLYNILRSVSTLQGLEYYSASRGEMRLLFEESWVIADPRSRGALPDPVVDRVPPEDVIFIHQKDKSFGSNESRMTFRAVPGAIWADIANLTPMRYMGIFRVADPENMQIHLISVPVREGLLVYGTMSARTRDVKAFADRARSSFTNRVIALTQWYRTRIGEEFGG